MSALVLILSACLLGGSGKHSSPSAIPKSYMGCCGTSAGVALDRGQFLVADDEDNRIRLYDREVPGRAIKVWDFSHQLSFGGKDKEADIEGAARIGDTVYWIGSHGRNRSGDYRQTRHCLFATTLSWGNKGVEVIFKGYPYRSLIEDLTKDKRFDFAGLRRASELRPTLEGGLNIEALSGRPNGGLWIGFRNPVPKGLALLVPLLNPEEVVKGQPAVFDNPVSLDLEGHGFRDMVWDGKLYWILGGNKNSHGQTRLYSWRGGSDAPVRFSSSSLKSLNPEALILPSKEREGWLTILSDDGSRSLLGKPCSELPQSSRSFRGIDLRVSAPR